VLADSVGLALLVVLDTLAPAERVAFVLHDMFGLPFDEIGPMVGRTPGAARPRAPGRRSCRWLTGTHTSSGRAVTSPARDRARR
jgi:DNA-directed RNA polymerase specialized sigma24 family protein